MANKKATPSTKNKSPAAKNISDGPKKGTAKKKATTKAPKKAGKLHGQADERAEPDPKAKLTSGSSPSFPIVGIGASAGGLEALEAFFEEMPADADIGFVLVVHLDPTHVSILPELLQKRTKMPVCQVRDGMRVEPNHVYVIPPNKELTILHGVLNLMELSQPRGANLPMSETMGQELIHSIKTPSSRHLSNWSEKLKDRAWGCRW